MTEATTEQTPGKRSVGRPRHYDEATERELLFKSAYHVLRDQRDNGFTIARVLAEAGVSTRSFYRHFTSKDELLCAMYLRDGQRTSARLTERVEAATGPLEAVEFWIDEMFSMRSGRRGERVSVLASITAVHAEGAEDVAEQCRVMLNESLARAITAGNEAGVFHSPDPYGDADLITSAVFHAAGFVTPHLGKPPEPGARDQVLNFTLRALGAKQH